MIGILYFSSTGNSLYIAQKIQSKMGGQIKYIPNYKGNGNEFEKIILVTPIYSYGMPTFVYNIIGIPLATGVWIPLFGWQLNPMFGAAAMSLSSFCVVTNALRLNFKKI
jgi:hypothetical protein